MPTRILAGPSLIEQIVTLLCICFVAVNNLFAYHAPSAIADEYEKAFHLQTKEFSTLFTIYSAPNVILVFFSGTIILFPIMWPTNTNCLLFQPYNPIIRNTFITYVNKADLSINMASVSRVSYSAAPFFSA